MHSSIGRLIDHTALLLGTLNAVINDTFFYKSSEKWSIAEHVEHLTLSAKPFAGVLSTPKTVFKKWQRPARHSASYQDTVQTYLTTLAKKGPANAPQFWPAVTPEKGSKAYITDFSSAHQKLVQELAKWSDDDMSRYFLPHPLLGHLTVLEMVDFTAYHISHHHRTILKLPISSEVSGN